MKQARKRLFIGIKTGAKERLDTVKWAVENNYDTLVFSLGDRFFKSGNRNFKYIKLAKQHSLFIEAGGRDFPLLLPRRLFFLHRDLFRMEQGNEKPITIFALPTQRPLPLSRGARTLCLPASCAK